jgi:dihydrofolate reductase
MYKEILEKILTSDNVVEEINNNLDVLLTIIPEIKYMIGFEHKNPNHHLDVWNHTLLALSFSENNYIIRLTLLLHDIGKPFSYTEGDIRHYKNHPQVSSKISYDVLKRLNYDEKFINKICYLVNNHDNELSNKEIEDNYELSLLRYKIQYCDALAHHPDKLEERKKYLKQINKYLEDNKTYNNLILIAAIGKNNELGKDNKLIWPLKEDLKFFRNQTMGNKIIMGYNTYLSLPKLLPGRKHIILTHKDIEFPKEVDVYHSKEELLHSISEEENIYVIGGASIYKQLINNSNKMLLTEIDKIDTNADAYFPQFNKDNWTSFIIDSNTENGIKYKHIKYLRKKEK